MKKIAQKRRDVARHFHILQSTCIDVTRVMHSTSSDLSVAKRSQNTAVLQTLSHQLTACLRLTILKT